MINKFGVVDVDD